MNNQCIQLKNNTKWNRNLIQICKTINSFKINSSKMKWTNLINNLRVTINLHREIQSSIIRMMKLKTMVLVPEVKMKNMKTIIMRETKIMKVLEPELKLKVMITT